MTDRPIETKRLQLRNLTDADVTESYLSWLNDPDVLRYLEVRFSKLTDLKDLGAIVKTVNDSRETQMPGIFLKGIRLAHRHYQTGPHKIRTFTCRNRILDRGDR